LKLKLFSNQDGIKPLGGKALAANQDKIIGMGRIFVIR